MKVHLEHGADSLETLIISDDDSATELVIILDNDGPRAVVERGAALGPCISITRSPTRGAVRNHAAAWPVVSEIPENSQNPEFRLPAGDEKHALRLLSIRKSTKHS